MPASSALVPPLTARVTLRCCHSSLPPWSCSPAACSAHCMHHFCMLSTLLFQAAGGVSP
jgi:hypothetical protein